MCSQMWLIIQKVSCVSLGYAIFLNYPPLEKVVNTSNIRRSGSLQYVSVPKVRRSLYYYCQEHRRCLKSGEI
jgi:hypothetical protein